VSTRALKIPDPSIIGPEDLLRLDVAAALAFKDGSMTISGLRREAHRGRLAVWRVAGKDYTTLRAIDEMKRRCRAHPSAPGSTSMNVLDEKRSGLSATAPDKSAPDALQAIASGLIKPSTSTGGRNSTQSSKVVQLPSRTP